MAPPPDQPAEHRRHPPAGRRPPTRSQPPSTLRPPRQPGVAHYWNTACSPGGRRGGGGGVPGVGSGRPAMCDRSTASTTAGSPPSLFHRLRRRRWFARPSASADLRAGSWRRHVRAGPYPRRAARAGLRRGTRGSAAARCAAGPGRRGEPGDAAVHAVRVRSGADAAAERLRPQHRLLTLPLWAVRVTALVTAGARGPEFEGNEHRRGRLPR